MFFPNSKKGNIIVEAVTIIVMLVVFAYMAIYGSSMFGDINTMIQDGDFNNETKTASSSFNTNLIPILDYAFLFMFILLIIFTIAISVFIDTHPIFMVVAIVLMIVLMVLIVNIANVFNESMQDSNISATANQFTFTTWIMQHLLEISVVLGFILIIAMFIKYKNT